ncbi:histidine kinase [Microbacterium esteraromaticum]|uniref:sensor histidine kinase n=1 Tax=Microbacterium esteraromaticum TaxID=57043 RepID=UPI001CD7F386|nr:histidine kinase [Microbacterium esteraromaticum]MCA1305511.1 histidine kinase [Microbacterium esteraromaticum]
MPPHLPSRDDQGRLRLNRGERLTTVERIVMLAFLAVLVAFDILNAVFTPEAGLTGPVLSATATAVFILYLWWPATATAVLGLVFALSVSAGKEGAVLFAAAIAAGMVLRLGATALVLSYAGGFLVATGVVAFVGDGQSVNVGVYLVVAAVAGAIGFALRLASARGERLEQQLAERAEQERQAVLAERRWIAGELHDSIAHHLTVVSLHVQLLDDPSARAESQDAIRIAARKAMADLRFVIDLADDGPRSAVHSGDLATAIAEASGEIEAAGHTVRTEGAPDDARIPRMAEIVLARIVRESTTNILKYAGHGDVVIRVETDDDTVALTMLSPLAETPRKDVPSSGTGLNRMAERVIGASGDFATGAEGQQWRVSARLPVI